MNSLTYLTLVITYRCSSRCRHCCIGAGPEFYGWMNVDEAEAYIADATKHGTITDMTLIGGEALLDIDRTIAIGTTALRYGITNVQVDTNGSWATDEKTASQILQRLLDAGLRISAISVDAFHQEFVARETVLNAMQAAARLGLRLKGSSEILEDEYADNPYDRGTRELSQWFGQRGFNVSPGGPPKVVWQGRAVSLTKHYHGPRRVPTETCSGVPWFATSDFRRLGGIQVDVNGWVMVEHGLCIGNARRQPLSEILRDYDADTHPILSILMKNGPIGLTRMAEANGFKLRSEGYIDKCHLCHEVRDYLQPAFPDILAPAACYPSEVRVDTHDTQ